MIWGFGRQQFDQLVTRVDYVSPFVYPSDFADHFLDFDKPADHPSEVVTEAIKAAMKRAGKVWLKCVPGCRTSRARSYDVPKVRAEIDAAEQNGASGWMPGTLATSTAKAH